VAAKQVRFLLLGEQATGKSSMLVALYGALVNHRAENLRIVRTIDDVEFLSRGLLAFGRQESVRRTEIDSHARLIVELARGEQMVSLDIPDRSGEVLKHTLDSRLWDPDLLEQVVSADAAMLFLRADRLEPLANPQPPLIAETPGGESGLAPPSVPVSAWSPALMQPDARTVDLLQALLEQRSRPLPLAVIISAWDSVGATALAPGDWLGQSVLLLDQYLTSNAARLPHAIFGVSAQGGDFAAGLPANLVGEDPWDRAYVIAPSGLRDTLAAPIIWMLDAVS
jgi:hypothetical protein